MPNSIIKPENLILTTEILSSALQKYMPHTLDLTGTPEFEQGKTASPMQFSHNCIDVVVDEELLLERATIFLSRQLSQNADETVSGIVLHKFEIYRGNTESTNEDVIVFIFNYSFKRQIELKPYLTRQEFGSLQSAGFDKENLMTRFRIK